MDVPTNNLDLSRPVLRYLTPCPATLYAPETVAAALERLRGESLGERIVYFYVLDERGELAGVVPTRKLLLAPLHERIGDLMTRPVVSLPQSATLRDAFEALRDRRLLAVPIVDDQHRLIGTIDVGLLGRKMGAEWAKESEDVFQLVGLHLADELQRSAWHSFRNRFPWLLLSLGSGLIMAWLTGLFHEELATAVAIVFFIPVILAIAESVAIQSLTITLQALHHWRVIGLRYGVLRSMALTALLGFGCGVLAAIVAYVWLGDQRLAVLLLGGMLISAIAGGAMGTAVPHAVHVLKLDPKLASGPAALALTDLAALAGYLVLARFAVA